MNRGWLVPSRTLRDLDAERDEVRLTVATQ